MTHQDFAVAKHRAGAARARIGFGQCFDHVVEAVMGRLGHGNPELVGMGSGCVVEGRKVFFFEKKKQKTFDYVA
jgi:hypothetical protein